MRQTIDWTHMSSQFLSTFHCTTEDMTHREVLHHIKDFILHRYPKVIAPGVACSYHQSVEKLKEVVHCWNINVENIDDDDPHDLQIKEF